MTDNTDFEQENGQIGGVSLASFLQMLEQERKSCTLIVNAGNTSGRFFFSRGELIDAEFEDQIGQEAVFTLLSWKSPSFTVAEAEDRLRRINQPLAHLLLIAATRQDEKKREVNADALADPGTAMLDTGLHANPVLKNLVTTILGISGVKHYYLLNRQGNMIVQSSRNKKAGDFITYCIITGIQVRKALQSKGPRRITLSLKNGDRLLIFPGAGFIIGLLIDADAQVDDVMTQLRPALLKGQGT